MNEYIICYLFHKSVSKYLHHTVFCGHQFSENPTKVKCNEQSSKANHKHQSKHHLANTVLYMCVTVCRSNLFTPILVHKLTVRMTELFTSPGCNTKRLTDPVYGPQQPPSRHPPPANQIT